MPHANVDIAVKARLAAYWSRCQVIAELNTVVDPLPAEFVTVVYPVANAEQMSIGAPGANIWRETGVFLVVLNVGRTSGSSAWLPWADELSALFRGKTFDGVQTFATTSAPMDNDNENGNFYELAVAVPYQYDIIG